MTTTATASPADTWTAQLEQLKARYKHIRPPILAALNILLHDPNIAADDAKAQAQMHGVRITAASIRAAQTLLSRMDEKPPAAPTPKAKGQPAAPTRAPRRARANETPFDIEGLVRGVVSKVQGQGNAEAERLRDAMRKAIALLQAATVHR